MTRTAHQIGALVVYIRLLGTFRTRLLLGLILVPHFLTYTLVFEAPGAESMKTITTLMDELALIDPQLIVTLVT